jgi:hypothetical protein
MKIRIKDNSIRYRLTKSEVQQLGQHNYIGKQTQFVNAVFRYQIIVKENIQELSAEFTDNCITLSMPKFLAQHWYTNDIITHKNEMLLPNGESLFLLLEKDFICLDHTHEDQSDNYQNPNKTC